MASRRDLLDAAGEVARSYRAHGAYGSEAKAHRALARRRPGFTARQYENAFRKAVTLYDLAVELVGRHADALLRQTDVAANRFPDFRDLAGEIRSRCPGLRTSTYRGALAWVFFWHHLK
jgi:hypothetical protein